MEVNIPITINSMIPKNAEATAPVTEVASSKTPDKAPEQQRTWAEAGQALLDTVKTGAETVVEHGKSAADKAKQAVDYGAQLQQSAKEQYALVTEKLPGVLNAATTKLGLSGAEPTSTDKPSDENVESQLQSLWGVFEQSIPPEKKLSFTTSIVEYFGETAAEYAIRFVMRRAALYLAKQMIPSDRLAEWLVDVIFALIELFSSESES